MSCINIYHPDYIKLLSEIDDSIIPFELPTLIRLYQKMNNTDKIPSVSEIYEIDNRTKSQERLNQIHLQGKETSNQIYSKLGNKTKTPNIVIQSVYQKTGVGYAKSIGGVFSLRVNGTNNHFGNPFSSIESEIQKGLIRTKSTRESVEKYIEWVLSPTTTIKPEQHKFIREWLQSGKLKGKSIVYYKELGEPSHATALDYLINKYDWNSQITPQQKATALQVYSQYLEQNPNGSLEQFKSWVDEFNRNKSNLEQQSENKTVDEIYKEKPYLKEFIDLVTDGGNDISIYKVKNILDKHGEGRIVKLNKILYNAINRLWDNNVFAQNNIKIKFVDSLPENAVGNFNRDNNEITVDKRKFLNNVFDDDKNYPIFYLGYILNHEIIHYLTPKDLSLKIEYVDRALNGKFGDTFRLEYEREFGKNIKELYDIAIKELDNVEDYGFLNLAEFVAEAMSNPSFQEKLASIPFKTSKKSLWKRFTEILSAYLSLNTKKPITDTLLEAVIAETTNYITENSNIQRTYKRRKSGKTENIDIGYDFVFTTQKNINSLSDFITRKSQEKLKAIQEIFNSSPELSKVGDVFSYAIYLDTIFPDSRTEEIDNSLYNSILNQLEQENKIEKDCSGGKLKAKDGIRGKFTKGSKWEIVKDLKGYPSHAEGGVDIKLGKDGFSFARKDGEIKAAFGLVLPAIKAQNGLVINDNTKNLKPTKAKNPNAKYEPVIYADEYEVNYKNVDEIIENAKQRKKVVLNDGIEYISDYGKDDKGEYISFYKKDGNRLNDLFNTSTEYYGRKYIDRTKFEDNKFEDRKKYLEGLHNEIKFNNLDTPVKYNYDNSLNLTQGRYNTGKIPKEMIDEMYDIAKKENIDIYDLLSVAGRESTFGINRGLDRYAVVSGWNLNNKYIPKSLSGFLADKKVPFITVYKDKLRGYQYEITDYSQYNDYLKNNPEIFDEYEKYVSTIPKVDYGKYNSYREVARMIKNNEMHKYNPGDKDYQNKLKKEKELLLKEKAITDYLKNLNSKTNKK